MGLMRTEFVIKLQEWTSSCASVNFEDYSGSFLVQDGQVNKLTIENPRKTEKNFIKGGGIAFIGQDQDGYGDLLDYRQSIKGLVGDFRLYPNKTIGQEILRKWTKQLNVAIPGKPLMSFDNFDDFTDSEVKIQIYDNESLFFKSPYLLRKFFSNEVDYEDAKFFCHALGGQLTLPTNADENQNLLDAVSKSKAMCQDKFRFQSSFWLGANIKNQTALHYTTKKPVLFSNFKDYLYSFNAMGECISFNGCKVKSPKFWGVWSRTTCTYFRKVVCSFENRPRFKIRGLKHGTLFDIEYFFNTDQTDPNFMGKFNSMIEGIKESNKTKLWKLFNINNPKVQAVTHPSPVYNYPIGYQTWNVSNDGHFGGSVTLGFSSCSDDEFTCSDGSCVDGNKRCDFQQQCLDGSDETNCKVVRFPEKGYNPSIPPSILEHETKFLINIQVNIQRVRNLDLDSFKLTTDICTTFQWTDSGVKFLNLKNEPKMNMIPVQSDISLWMPEYLFRGYNFSLTDVTESNPALCVVKKSIPEQDNPHYLYAGNNLATYTKLIYFDFILTLLFHVLV